MSFAGVDEAKLVSEMKKQILPVVEEMLNNKLSELKQLLTEGKLEVTYKLK